MDEDKEEEEEEEEEEQKWSLQSLWHLIRGINKRQGVSLKTVQTL